jgi:hypothetical protein
MNNETLHLIIYISKAEIAPGEINKTIEEICQVARRENGKRNITGIIFYENGYFVQALEGSKEVLDQLMTNIQADSRHSQVKILVNKAVNRRIFPDWAMRGLSLADHSLFNPETISYLHDIYQRNVEITDASFVLFLDNMINDINFQSLFR